MAKVTDPQGKRSVEYAALTKGQQLTQDASGGRSADSGGELEGGGTIRAKSRWARFCDGKASLSVGPEVAGHAVRQGAAAAGVRRDAGFGGLRKKPSRWARPSCATATLWESRLPVRSSAAAAVAAIHAEWKSEPQPSNKELFDYLRKNTAEGNDPTGDGDRLRRGLSGSGAEFCRSPAAADLHRVLHRARSARTARCAGEVGRRSV